MQRIKAFGLAFLVVLIVQTAHLTPKLQSLPVGSGAHRFRSRGLTSETHFAEFLLGATAGVLAGLSLRNQFSRWRFRVNGTLVQPGANRATAG